MTQLVVLGITNIKGKAQMDDLCTSLNNMTLLQRLTITTGNEKEILHLDALILPRLQYLTLFGKLKKFPLWICSLPSLIDLQMHWSCLPVEEEPLRHLKRLPSLSSIYLNNACQGTQLVFPRGFDNLKTLALNDFGGLESIEIAQGAMPALKILQVSSCMNLKTVPQGIHHLTELEQFRLEIVAVKLVERIRGPDRCCVRHIPLVQCCYYSSTGRYIQENLF
ncbi:Disease resistance protein RPM1 [Linum grandiflorum]